MEYVCQGINYYSQVFTYCIKKCNDVHILIFKSLVGRSWMESWRKSHVKRFITLSQQLTNLNQGVEVVLEEDGTEIDDEEWKY